MIESLYDITAYLKKIHESIQHLESISASLMNIHIQLKKITKALDTIEINDIYVEPSIKQLEHRETEEKQT